MSQDTISLTLEPRSVTGKAVKHLRKAGQVPAVIHDHGKDSVIVQGNYNELFKVYMQAGKHHPVELKAGTKTYTAMIKAADFEPKKHTLSHLVFNAVTADQKVEAEVPIQPRYEEGNEASPAERAGLMVLSNTEAVMVSALPKDLPDVLYYDAEKLVEVGDHATVADLVVPAGVELKVEATQGIATVYEPSAVAAANDAAGGTAEPEEEEPAEETEEGAETAEGEETPTAEGEAETKPTEEA